MDISTELQRLLDMRHAGHLSETEFQAAKARLLGDPAPPASAPPVFPPPSAPSAWPVGVSFAAAPPPASPSAPAQPGGGHAPTADAYESPYYQRQFAGFDANGGQFAATWNWAAFIFGAFWYLVRGMWAKAVVIFAITLFSAGYLAIPLWIYTGVAGNYDYYLLRRKRTQLWS